MMAEVFLDAVDQATGHKTRFSGVAASSRAVDLPHEGFGSYFLDTFDRPRRVTTCECERSSGATLAQVLLLANSDEIENKIAAGDGKIAKLLGSQTTDQRDCRGTVPRRVLAPPDPRRSWRRRCRSSEQPARMASDRRWKTCSGP